MRKASVRVQVKKIYAGKFRRFHKVPLWRQVLAVGNNLKNARDFFLMIIGFFQSFWLLVRFKPDAVFTKGGFVCVPLGFAAHLLKIPIVIHDSDPHPGLANRIVARWATSIATGSPVENYPYPKHKTHYVGTPVASVFKPVSSAAQQRLKAALGLHDTKKPLIAVTGGGLGARNLNLAVAAIAPKLLDKAAIVHVTGTSNYQETLDKAPEDIDYICKPFISGLAPLFGAADIVVTRAGATTLQELAAMAKPTVIVPNPFLTAGHQLKTGELYRAAKAAVIVDEHQMVANSLVLYKALAGLLAHDAARAEYGKRLQTFAKPDAAVDVAGLIAEAAAVRKHQNLQEK